MSRTLAKISYAISQAPLVFTSHRNKEKTLARLCSSIENKGIRDIATPFGSLKMKGRSGAGTASLLNTFADDEPETLYWINDIIQKDEILYDIGGHIGLFSLCAAKKGAQVFTFEPSPANYALLCEHIQMNNLSHKIHPFALALSNETKIETLTLSDLSGGAAGHGIKNEKNTNHQNWQQAVPAMRLDACVKNFSLPMPQHIKLDVDGIEPLILEGAAPLLKQVKSLLIEIEGDNIGNQKLLDIIQKAGLNDLPIPETVKSTKGAGRNRIFIRS